MGRFYYRLVLGVVAVVLLPLAGGCVKERGRDMPAEMRMISAEEPAAPILTVPTDPAKRAAKIAPREHVEPLLNDLRSPQREVKTAAKLELTKRGWPVAGYVAELLSDADWQVRMAACEILGYARDPTYAEAVAKLATAPQPDLREEVAFALGLMGQNGQAELVLRTCATLLHDPVPYVRKAAALALWDLPTPGVQEPLLGAMQDKDENVRRAAARAVVRAAQRNRLSQNSSGVLAAALSNPGESADVQEQAALALGYFTPDSQVVTGLKAGLVSRNDLVRAASARSAGLLRIAEADVVETLRKMREDDSALVRHEAQSALDRIGYTPKLRPESRRPAT